MEPTTPDPDPLVTAVIGAGPAGLLFCVATRLMLERAEAAERWVVRLYDKRVGYVRTHRLRMAPGPYRALGGAVDDPRFDALIQFLEDERFKPEVNALEQRLSALAEELGVHRERLEIGSEPPAVDLPDLRKKLEDEGVLRPGQPWTVVGADSVHSAVRDLVRGGVEPVEKTHEQLVRIRVTGPGLPDELGMIEQYRWAKLLGSLLDYRLNRNGFAEVDLFLAPREHGALDALGATPSRPVPLTDAHIEVLDAPLFVRIARQFQRGFGEGPCDLALYSSFVLEHRVMPVRSFPIEDGRAFLVGDAAISLPFFRGMACLASCAQALAETHTAIATGTPIDQAAEDYQARTERVARRELAMVAARARLVRFGREFSRISGLLPFPMQRWWLSLEVDDRRPARWTAGVALNLVLAVPPAVIALVAPLLDAHVWEPLGWLWLFALPFQMVGAAAYYAVRAFEPPNRALGWVWRAQILVLMVAGPAVTMLNSWALARPAQLHSLMSWWVLGIAFALGLVVFERLQRSLWDRADLDAG